MKKQKFLVNTLYVILFILCCWNWIYTMAICSDSPVNISFNEFIVGELSIMFTLLLFVYLTIKGHNVLNIGLLFIPNLIWTFTFTQDILFNYHIYSTVLSSSMMIVMIIVLVWNSFLIYKEIKEHMK